ncbi:unnamed protein product, partial [Darwinula stevensoni]
MHDPRCSKHRMLQEKERRMSQKEQEKERDDQVDMMYVHGVACVELIPYLGVHPGQRYENVTSESQELSLGTCTINCVMQEPIPCYAFNYRETDRSCQLILNRTSELVDANGYWTSELVDANGYWSYAQWLCLREYPTIENAIVSFEGWNGTYPAPARGIVKFRCEHPKGFSDGALLHTAECAPLNPDSWCISFREGAVQCEKVHIYPECRLTESGEEYVGKVSVTESGMKCLKWRDYPDGTGDDYQGGPHLNFTTSDPSGTPIINLREERYFLNRDSWSHHNYCRNPYWGKRPWCYVSNRNITWEYCNIPMCTNTGEKVHIYPECRLTESGEEYVGKVSVTESGMKCLKWRDYPDGTGDDYQGGPHLNFTTSDPSGTPIINLREERYFLNRDSWSHHNYCRNPYWGKRPWCYVFLTPLEHQSSTSVKSATSLIGTPGEKVHIYPECRLTERGKEYVGKVSVTESGLKCLKWRDYPDGTWDDYPGGPHLNFTTSDPSGTPIINLREERYFLNRDSWSHHNYCRNPYWGKRPWCYVFNRNITWEYCNIPMCTNRGEKVHIYPECRLTESGEEYVGKVSVTESGMKCLKWRDYPDGTGDDYQGGPHLNFTTSDPSGTPIINLREERYFLNRDSWSHHNYCRNPYWGKRPWCYVSNRNITWEYCNIPMCTNT